jgi:hypothetical protein
VSYVLRRAVEINEKPGPYLKIVEPSPLHLAPTAAPPRDDTKRPAGGNALTVIEAWSDGLGLIVAERIEDAQIASTVMGLEAWAIGDAATMATLASSVPAWAESVTIIPSPSAASAAAARQLAASLTERGIEVRIVAGGRL